MREGKRIRVRKCGASGERDQQWSQSQNQGTSVKSTAAGRTKIMVAGSKMDTPFYTSQDEVGDSDMVIIYDLVTD